MIHLTNEHLYYTWDYTKERNVPEPEDQEKNWLFIFQISYFILLILSNIGFYFLITILNCATLIQE